MDLVRNLPASEAAPELAHPAVDLASGGRVSEPVLAELRDLTDALLDQAASRAAQATTLELRVRARSNAVRLEVRWNDAAGQDSRPDSDRVRVRDDPAEVNVRRLADRCGTSHRHDRRCLWAEKRLPISERRSA